MSLLSCARVQAVLAVAGVPGGSYSALFGAYGVPRRLRTPMGRVSSRLLPVMGPLLPLVACFYAAATVGSALDHHRGRGVVWKRRAYQDAGA